MAEGVPDPIERLVLAHRNAPAGSVPVKRMLAVVKALRTISDEGERTSIGDWLGAIIAGHEQRQGERSDFGHDVTARTQADVAAFKAVLDQSPDAMIGETIVKAAPRKNVKREEGSK